MGLFNKPSALNTTAASITVAGVERPPRDEDEVRRDGKGRPYIRRLEHIGNFVPETKEEVTYTRVTTYIDCVDDKSTIARWGERQLVKGLLGPRGARFRAECSALLDDSMKRKLNDKIKQIKEAAGAEDQAAIGTAVHAITERYDLGLPLGSIDELYQADLDAYVSVTKYFKHVWIERMLVNDELKTAGTPDRITEYLPCEVCGKTTYIFDLKTGRVDNYTQNSQAMQLAIYAHSSLYEHATGERTPLDVCLHRGIICALPAGTGQAHVEWIDIAHGWELVKVATAVRKARNEKAMRLPFTPAPNLLALIQKVDGPNAAQELNMLYKAFAYAWTQAHTDAGNARLEAIRDGRS